MTHVEYPSIEEFLPHRGTMLLLSGVLSLSETQANVASDAEIQTWYQGPAGAMPSWIGIELMAQAVAVHVGWSKKQQGQPPKQGVLLGTRRYRAEQAVFFGALEVSARMILMDEGGMGAYECSIASQGQLVAQATVKVFEPENFEEFLRSQREA